MILGSPTPKRAKRANPANGLKTPRDKRLWEAAKVQASHMGHDEDWDYTMGVFQRMKHRQGGAVAPSLTPVKKASPKPSRQAPRKNPRANPVMDAHKQAQRDIEVALKGTGLVVDNAGTSGEYADIQLSNGLVVAVCVKPAPKKRKNPSKKKAKKSARKPKR